MTPAIDATLTPTDHPLIGLDARGRPWVFGTNTKLIEIVRGFYAPPESTVESYLEDFPYLTTEQVRAALDYYATHKEAMDEQFRRADEEYERLKQATWNPELQEKLARLKAERKRPS